MHYSPLMISIGNIYHFITFYIYDLFPLNNKPILIWAETISWPQGTIYLYQHFSCSWFFFFSKTIWLLLSNIYEEIYQDWNNVSGCHSLQKVSNIWKVAFSQCTPVPRPMKYCCWYGVTAGKHPTLGNWFVKHQS